MQPDVIVNATGTWVDETLAKLHVPSELDRWNQRQPPVYLQFAAHRHTWRARNLRRSTRWPADISSRRSIIRCLSAPRICRSTHRLRMPDRFSSRDRIPVGRRQLDCADAKLEPGDVAFHYAPSGRCPMSMQALPPPLPDGMRWSQRGGPYCVAIHHWREANDHAVPWRKQLPRASYPFSTAREARFPHATLPGGREVPSKRRGARCREKKSHSTAFSLEQVEQAWKLLGTRAEAVLSKSTDRQSLPDTDLPVASRGMRSSTNGPRRWPT